MGFDDAAVQRAGDALKPRFSHKAQIERIASRLGLAPDGDVAKLWIELNEAYGLNDFSFKVGQDFRERLLETRSLIAAVGKQLS
jgi:hypothetical protein